MQGFVEAKSQRVTFEFPAYECASKGGFETLRCVDGFRLVDAYFIKIEIFTKNLGKVLFFAKIVNREITRD